MYKYIIKDRGMILSIKDNIEEDIDLSLIKKDLENYNATYTVVKEYGDGKILEVWYLPFLEVFEELRNITKLPKIAYDPECLYHGYITKKKERDVIVLIGTCKGKSKLLLMKDLIPKNRKIADLVLKINDLTKIKKYLKIGGIENG